jgi:hypothetical protein
MSEQKPVFPNSGTLSPAKSRLHPKSPDMNGDIKIERSLLRQLMDEQDGDDIKIRLSGWTRSGDYGSFISIAVNTYKSPAEALPKTHMVKVPDAPVDDSDIPF